MLQLTLKDSSNTTQIVVEVPDQTSADTWIANAASGIWGKPDRWVTAQPNGSVPSEDITKSDQNRVVTLVAAIPAVDAVLDKDGNVVTPAQLAVPAVTETQYHFPAEYTITQTDISAQVAQQAAVQKGLQCQQVGAEIIAAIFAMNEAKLAAGALTVSQIQSMMQDPTVSLIRELLWAGSLTTAKALISSYNGPYFSSSDVAQILPLLASY